MTALLQGGLPAADLLRNEGIEVVEHDPVLRAKEPDLVIAILNLMPDKVATETQLIRMLGDGHRQVEIVLFATNAYMARVRDPDFTSANTPVEHMRRYYRSFDEVRDMDIDGLIVTGAPVEREPFEDVPYWEELLDVYAWAQQRQTGVFSICWAAQAALRHFHEVPKYVLDRKMFGVFEHRIERHGDLLAGFGDSFRIPVSRHSEIYREDLPDSPDLVVLADSDELGLGLLEDRRLRHHYMFNHFEYDADTLKREYDRDVEAGDAIQLPAHYYPDDDPGQPPVEDWREDGRRMYQNWLATIEADKDATIE
ncbi:MAG: homoserine O-acetyltransferase/O-succinyltransferase family protein [Minwuia sp.]|uniref:homoserine O-acetyltransferase/O-succinyltransferase family protein n=1 Tax=Minwuia sp. TaxID=2493630 RepID=UPI003A8BCB8A